MKRVPCKMPLLSVMAVALCHLTSCAGTISTAPATAPPTTAVATTATAVQATLVPMDILYDILVHPPTCQTNGYSVYVNKETGAINIRDEVPRLQHEWVEADGKRVCKNCGVEKNEQN